MSLACSHLDKESWVIQLVIPYLYDRPAPLVHGKMEPPFQFGLLHYYQRERIPSLSSRIHVEAYSVVCISELFLLCLLSVFFPERRMDQVQCIQRKLINKATKNTNQGKLMLCSWDISKLDSCLIENAFRDVNAMSMKPVESSFTLSPLSPTNLFRQATDAKDVQIRHVCISLAPFCAGNAKVLTQMLSD